MSRIFTDIPGDKLSKIKRSLLINTLPKNAPFQIARYVYLYDEDGTTTYLPFFYPLDEIKSYTKPYSKLSDLRKTRDYAMGDFKFEATLREEQVKVKDEAITLLNKQRSCIISSYTGFGKTIISIYIARLLGIKTLIAVNRLTLMSQWKKSIQDFCGDNVKVQIIRKHTDAIDTEADFYIINAINIPKKHRDEYRHIPLLVVDECHLLMSAVLSKSLTHISPHYLIGLSATPYREDGLNVLFDMFFGKEKIYRKLNRKHEVRVIHTGWKPETEYMSNGKVDWNHTLNQQSTNEVRNKLIADSGKDLIDSSEDTYALIVCKRVSQIHVLETMIKELGISVTCLVGSKQDYDEDARVLIGTLSKVGTGVDHKKLNVLILATDVKAFFIQTLGRIFRKTDTVPIVIDFVDNDPILKRHYKTREKIYKEVGGLIKIFKTLPNS